ncbi:MULTISPECIES: hypothetical protein [unclassified Micromonospora]|uniref:hypothetical protein n=1 Tax=unclassified Micromonospora TaxID=2617518 RepID=UPI0020B3539B|nr:MULTISPECIES: hypothetical protein [unclassified Micromonospora]MDM4780898.1 hypothetical protein [Micromonospora sp. b486]
MAEFRIVRGDATSPQAKGPKIVAHVCNDHDLGGWGKGLSDRGIPVTVYDRS